MSDHYGKGSLNEHVLRVIIKTKKKESYLT